MEDLLDVLDRFHHNNGPSELFLWDIRFDRPCVERLIDFLHHKRAVESLRLQHCSFSPDDACLSVLCRFLSGNMAPPNVVLTACDLGNNGAQQILEALETNKSVRKLSLSNNRIRGAIGGAAIGAFLKNNTYMEVLDISRNILGVEAMSGIREGLTENSILRCLNMNFCRIGNEELKRLVPAKHERVALVELFLENNNMQGASGGACLGKLLTHCPQVQVLSLDYNNLGAEGGRALRPALSGCDKLQRLFLSCCGLGNDGSEHIVEAIRHSSALVQFHISGNGINGPAALARKRLIQYLTKRNTLLTKARPLLETPPEFISHALWSAAIAKCAQHDQGAGATYSILERMIGCNLFLQLAVVDEFST